MQGIELIIGGSVLALVVLGVVAFVFSRMEVVPQTHAMIVSGARTKDDGAKVVKPGGRAFIIPVIQKAQKVPLGQINVRISVSGVDKNKIPISVDGVAMVKVRQDETSIRDAQERFGSAANFEEEIRTNLELVLTGSLRAAIATMTVEALLINRESLAQGVRSTTDAEVAVMGLSVDSLQVLDISDRQGYIQALGAREAEKVKAEARIATAENNQLATDAEVTSEQTIAERQRDLSIRQAQLKSETDRETAIALAAGPLAKAEQDRKIAALQQQTAAEEALLKERQLDIEIRKPADAEKYRTEVEAAARAEQTKIIARAEAEKTKIAAQADADAISAIAEADATRVLSIGKAEAEAIEAKGLAEAETMDRKADAYEKYGQAAIIELIIQQAPAIARELAAPLGNIDNISIIGGEGMGALPAAVANNFAQLDSVTENLTGISLRDLVRGVAGGAMAGKLAEATGANNAVSAGVAAAVASMPARLKDAPSPTE